MMISLFKTIRRLSLRPSSMCLTEHRLPKTEPLLLWYEEKGNSGGTLFILRRWGLVIDYRPKYRPAPSGLDGLAT